MKHTQSMPLITLIMLLMLTLLISRGVWAVNLTPGTTITIPYPDMPLTSDDRQNGRTTTSAQMTIYLPKNYTLTRRYPLLVNLGGGSGGLGNAPETKLGNGMDFIAVNVPLFMSPTPHPGVVNQADADVMWPYFKTMMEDVEKTVPNVDPAYRMLMGFSNGAHMIGFMMMSSYNDAHAHDPNGQHPDQWWYITRRFSAFCLQEGGGAFMRSSSLSLIRGKRFCAESSQPGSLPAVALFFSYLKAAGPASAHMIFWDQGGHGYSINDVNRTWAYAPMLGIDSPPTVPAPTASSYAIAAGQSVTFSIAASDPLGYPLTTVWNYGVPQIAGRSETLASAIPAYTYTTGGTYTVTAIVGNGRQSKSSPTITITVSHPPIGITAQPADLTVPVGTTAKFSVTADGTSAISYQWQKSTDGGVTYTNITGATGSVYTTPATVIGENQARFHCVATDAAGSATSTAAILTVNPPEAPVFTTDLNGTVPFHIHEGGQTNFSVAASGAPTYQWQKSTDYGKTFTDIPGATGSSYSTAPTPVSEDHHYYRCIATNASGAMPSRARMLLVDAQWPITLIAQPPDQQVLAGTTALYTVSAIGGKPNPYYQWAKSTNGGTTFTNIPGANSNFYVTQATTAADTGTLYRCTMKNYDGSGAVTTRSALLTVPTAPIAPGITVQPANAGVGLLQTATFGVTASGCPAPAYQWRKSTDGGTTWMDIPGAIASSYITPSAVVADNGTKFCCAVSNAAGNVTSNAVTLTVGGAATAPMNMP